MGSDNLKNTHGYDKMVQAFEAHFGCSHEDQEMHLHLHNWIACWEASRKMCIENAAAILRTTADLWTRYP